MAIESNIPESWDKYSIGDFGKVITGKTPSKNNPEDWGDKIDFITPSDIPNKLKVIANCARKLSGLGENRFNRMILPSGSVIVTCIGSDMGKVVMNKHESLTNQQINSIIINDTFSNEFIYYLLKNSYKALRRAAEGSGSTMPLLNKSHFESLSFEIPPLPEQKAIAKVLTAFDDKIELLQAQNKTLETMAQTIFEEWFGKYQIGDELPEGWRVVRLGDVMDIFDSQRVPLSKGQREAMKGDYRYYGATKVMDYVNDYLFDGIYLLFAEDGSVMNEDGYPFLQYVWGKFWVNNHTHILKGKNGFSTELLYVLCKKMKVAGIVTGAVQLKINQGNLLSKEIVLPTDSISDKVDKIIQPLFNKLRTNSFQVQSLTKTRDTLLPKLMSGQVRVNNLKQNADA